MEASTKEPTAGQKVDAGASNGKPDPQAAQESVSIAGSSTQLTLTLGGKTPTTSSMRLLGGGIKVEGEFKKGDVVKFSGVARVVEVGAKDEIDDKTLKPVGCERRHRARILELNAVEVEAAA